MNAASLKSPALPRDIATLLALSEIEMPVRLAGVQTLNAVKATYIRSLITDALSGR